MTKHRSLALWRGTLDMLPLSLAVLPWGILFGSLAIQRGFSAWETQAISALVFGGAVQIVSIELLAQGTPLVAVLFSAFVISSRHFLYGLHLRERMSCHPLPWRLSIGFLLTDELFALSGDRRAYRHNFRLWYALGAGGSFYLAWNLWTAIGILGGNTLPDLSQLGVEFAIAAIFIALVIPNIKDLASAASVIIAAGVAVFMATTDSQVGLIIAACAGMAAGYLVQTCQEG
ncbi:MAG TPA: AzlC family ABC transporter permease [Pseudomonadales bacterium]|nr:AzlC family ABC transporter permease [Pseudomonadales bacterium]